MLINKKAQKNYLENYWRQLFNYEKGILNWKVVYKQKVKSVKYVKLAEFNYKVLNNIVPCGKIVSHWDESISKYCCRCNVVQDCKHLLYTCPIFKSIWDKVGSILKINIKWKHIVIGFGIFDVDEKIVTSRNFLISNIAYILFSIYSKHFDKFEQETSNSVFNMFKGRLKYYICIYKKVPYVSKAELALIENVYKNI